MKIKSAKIFVSPHELVYNLIQTAGQNVAQKAARNVARKASQNVASGSDLDIFLALLKPSCLENLLGIVLGNIWVSFWTISENLKIFKNLMFYQSKLR